MLRAVPLVVVLYLTLTSQGYAQPTPGKSGPGRTVLEQWDAAYLQGGKAGYVHTFTQEVEQAGQKLLRTTVELRLNVKRNADTVQLGMDTGTVETQSGKVTGVFMRQFLGKNKTLDLTGTVDGDQLKLALDKVPLKPAPWDDSVVGLHRQQRLLKERQVKPGDRFDYLSFEPSVNLVVQSSVHVKDWEDIELFAGQKKHHLLRVETQPAKIQNVQLPALVAWVDESYQPLRSEVEVPGLGKIVLYRTSKAAALAPSTPSHLTDIGLSQVVRLSRTIARPYLATAATYKVTIKGEADAASLLSQDERQISRNARGDTFELEIVARRPGKSGRIEKPSADYLKSCYFINSTDAKVKELARKAAGSELDPWRKALRIEKWVHENMKTANHEALATADHVARTLTGDCTEFAMLMAAMCRAEGIPARTAVGLIYAQVRGGPAFAFHMWTEVFSGGHWIPLDATLGQGFVGATHIKIADQGWHNERTLTPLLPVVRVLGRIAIEVVQVEGP